MKQGRDELKNSPFLFGLLPNTIASLLFHRYDSSNDTLYKFHCACTPSLITGQANPLPVGLFDRPLQTLCLFGIAEIGEHHCPGEHHRRGIDAPSASQVRCRAMYWFKVSIVFAKAGAR